MKKMMTGLVLAVLLLSTNMLCGVLHADELLTRQRVFVPDEGRQQWVNERNGRSGTLEVHGTLLSSPCTLRTNEIMLPLPAMRLSDGRQTRLSLDLTGCGYGEDLTSTTTPAGQTSVIVVYSALLTGTAGEGLLQPAQQTPTMARVVLHGGSAKLTWYLSEVQQKLLTPSGQDNRWASPVDTALRLRLDYE